MKKIRAIYHKWFNMVTKNLKYSHPGIKVSDKLRFIRPHPRRNK